MIRFNYFSEFELTAQAGLISNRTYHWCHSSAVSRFTETDRNGPKRTFVDTETDSLSTETDSLGTETDRNGPKRTFVDTETDSLSTETDSLGTETDFFEYRNGLCGYRIVIWGVKIDSNTKNRYKLQCLARADRKCRVIVT